MDLIKQLEKAKKAAWNILLKDLNESCYFQGELSVSPLATALAIFALYVIDKKKFEKQIEKGLNWLATCNNFDGGWGDSVDSPSNVPTSLLVWNSFAIANLEDSKYSTSCAKVERYLNSQIGSLVPENISRKISGLYGTDQTFSTPILATCAMSGRLGTGISAWDHVSQLPYELLLFPQTLFKTLKLNVVSYALPALIAIGMVRHKCGKKNNKFLWFVRERFEKRFLKVLTDMQPESGGFLEAIPLTSFVIMSIAFSGFKKAEVVNKGTLFLLNTQHPNGAWAIDSNLSTWLTLLTIKNIPQKNKQTILPESVYEKMEQWIVKQQFKEVHPFTGASPGGWGWTHLPGSVPDGDDTSGALIALNKFDPKGTKYAEIAKKGIKWLLGIQNTDGGIPTFCRGWGRLPFDKSCPDITAHAIHALFVWKRNMPLRIQKEINKAIRNAIDYLQSSMHEEGYWVPLWFGNQHHKEKKNAVYGTSCVLYALNHCNHEEYPKILKLMKKAQAWMLSQQNEDGGWGAQKGLPSSIEETALALAVLNKSIYLKGIKKGSEWLLKATKEGTHFPPTPIGLYFANLWYSEKLYPLIFFIKAMNRVNEVLKVNITPLKPELTEKTRQ